MRSLGRVVADAPDTPGQPDWAHWEACTWDEGDHVHVVPMGDVIVHDEGPDGDCICGVTTEPCERYDGSIGWLYTHHSVDGRERFENQTS